MKRERGRRNCIFFPVDELKCIFILGFCSRLPSFRDIGVEGWKTGVSDSKVSSGVGLVFSTNILIFLLKIKIIVSIGVPRLAGEVGDKNAFLRLFRKICFFLKKLSNEKLFKTSFPKEKVILIFVARRFFPLKWAMVPGNGFSQFLQKILLFFSKKLFTKKVFKILFFLLKKSFIHSCPRISPSP